MDNSSNEICEIFQSNLSIINSEQNLTPSLLTEQDKYLIAYIKTVSQYIEKSKFTTINGLYSLIEEMTESFLKTMLEKKIITKTEIAI